MRKIPYIGATCFLTGFGMGRVASGDFLGILYLYFGIEGFAYSITDDKPPPLTRHVYNGIKRNLYRISAKLIEKIRDIKS